MPNIESVACLERKTYEATLNQFECSRYLYPATCESLVINPLVEARELRKERLREGAKSMEDAPIREVRFPDSAMQTLENASWSKDRKNC
jgi:hypothetical protein